MMRLLARIFGTRVIFNDCDGWDVVAYRFMSRVYWTAKPLHSQSHSEKT